MLRLRRRRRQLDPYQAEEHRHRARLALAEIRLQQARELGAEIASWPEPLEVWLRMLRGEGPNTVVGRAIPAGPDLRRPLVEIPRPAGVGVADRRYMGVRRVQTYNGYMVHRRPTWSTSSWSS